MPSTSSPRCRPLHSPQRGSIQVALLLAAVAAAAVVVAAAAAESALRRQAERMRARGDLTAASAVGLGLEVFSRRLLRAAFLVLDDLERAQVAGTLAVPEWRQRASARLGGFEQHALAAVLEAQDGDSGLRHPLAGFRSVRAALAGLGLPASLGRDRWAQAWRLEPGPAHDFRSVAGGVVFGAW